jgi:hypothetical protein
MGSKSVCSKRQFNIIFESGRLLAEMHVKQPTGGAA